ncbi:MAG TPA: hypothetical protein VFB54_16815 [Burkholderiales bacterium]|nr:hypothetical protein [Burkholderiales bacterium]
MRWTVQPSARCGWIERTEELFEMGYVYIQASSLHRIDARLQDCHDPFSFLLIVAYRQSEARYRFEA